MNSNQYYIKVNLFVTGFLIFVITLYNFSLSCRMINSSDKYLVLHNLHSQRKYFAAISVRYDSKQIREAIISFIAVMIEMTK